MSNRKYIIIPTGENKPSKIGKCIKELSDVKIGQVVYFSSPLFMSLDYFQPHHLFELSDDELKVGDWYFNLSLNFSDESFIPYKIDEFDTPDLERINRHKDVWSKIVASTNPEISWNDISDVYIKSYVDSLTKTKNEPEPTYTTNEVKNLLRRYKRDVYSHLKIFTTGAHNPFHQDWLDKNLKK